MKNYPSYITEESLFWLIDNAIREDVGDGDHSSLSSVPAQAQEKAQLIIKDNGIIAGLELAEIIFKRIDNNFKVNLLLEDGATVKKGDIGLTVEGSAQSILKAERLVLNCMQRMSGIATHTAHLTQMIAHTKARLLDTRKTTPNFRIFKSTRYLNVNILETSAFFLTFFNKK